MPSAKALLSRLRGPRQVSPDGGARVRRAVWGGGPPAPGARLVLDPHTDEDGWHARLAGAGPFDVVVDRSGDPEGAAQRFRVAFLHLARGGRYRVPARGREVVTAVSELAVALRDGTHPGGSADAALASAIGDVKVSDGGLVVRRTGATVAKLREAEMNVALAEDPSRGRILETVPGVSFESRCTLTRTRAPVRDRVLDRYDAPDLFLREYDDVICRFKAIVEQRGLLTPDTFRHHLAQTLTHKRLADAGPKFAVAPRPRTVTDRLDGTFFHLDNEIRGFFGHALTEQVARLWAWPGAQERFPGIRVLVSLNRGRPLAVWEWTLLAAAGIDRRDVVVIDRPVRVERLVAPTPMFSMPAYVHPEIVHTWDRLGVGLRSASTLRDHPPRIFCSRRHDKRACLNRGEVEALFTDHGFEIVFPEDYPLPDQVELFHRAEVVAGFAGSGMFTTMFSDRPKHVILVSSDTYRATNEYLIGSVRRHRLDIAVGTTPAQLPEGESIRSKKSLTWPFTVDMDAEGAWLRELLAGLGPVDR